MMMGKGLLILWLDLIVRFMSGVLFLVSSILD